MYHEFLRPRGLQDTHMDTLKPKINKKSIAFTVKEGFFTFWVILAHSVAPQNFQTFLRPCGNANVCIANSIASLGNFNAHFFPQCQRAT